jgi:HEAT repeat protein
VYEGRTIAQWIDLLGSPSADVGRQAGDVLVRIGPDAVPALLQARQAMEMVLHRRAVAALVRIGPAAAGPLAATLTSQNDRIETGLVRMGTDAVPALIEGLGKDHRAEAARVLGLIGPRAVSAAAALRALATDSSSPAAARGEALRALVRIGAPATEAIPPLVAALADPDSLVRERAAEGLGALGRGAAPAVPALARAAEDPNDAVAAAACLALGCSAQDVAATPLKQAFLREGAAARMAGQALVLLGPHAASIIAGMAELTREEKGPGPHARQLLVRMRAVAVPALMNRLQDKNPLVQIQAADLLREIGPPAAAAIPALVALRNDKVVLVRRAAVRAVAHIDPERVGDALSVLTDSADLPSSIEALTAMGPLAASAVKPLLAGLGPKDVGKGERREAVVRALAQFGPAAFGQLIEAVGDADEKIAGAAAEALAAWGDRPGKAAVTALRGALERSHLERATIAQALGKFGPAAAEAIPDLKALLGDSRLRAEAAVALVRIDPAQAPAAVAALRERLRTPLPAEQRLALVTLQRIGPPGHAAVPNIISLLQESPLQVDALRALAAIGPEARDAIPSILPLLRDRAEEVHNAARDALSRMGGDAIGPLTKALHDLDPNVREAALQALAQMGSAAAPSIPALLEELENPNGEFRAACLSVLSSIGPDAKAALPSLPAQLNAPETNVRIAACAALAAIGAEAKSARDSLLECLLDPSSEVRSQAIRALEKIDPSSPETSAGLRDALNDLDPLVRFLAARTLAGDAASRPAASAALAVLARTPAPDLALSAAEVLVEWKAPEAREVLGGLHLLFRGGDVPTRLRAAALLLRLNDSAAEALPLLLRGLQVRGTSVPLAALDGLQKAGAAARPALAWLRRAADDPTPAIRQAAQKAIAAVEKAAGPP